MAELLDLWMTMADSRVVAVRDYVATRHNWLVTLTVVVFTTINSIRILAYFPQIMKAARDRNGATAISCSTWGLFLVSHLATIAYAVVVVGDAVMALIFLGNAFACFAIVGVTLLKRRAHARRVAEA
ncbi:MAG: hypothetical protein ACOCYE_06665 [Pseudomonadota bacterium]